MPDLGTLPQPWHFENLTSELMCHRRKSPSTLPASSWLEDQSTSKHLHVHVRDWVAKKRQHACDGIHVQVSLTVASGTRT